MQGWLYGYDEISFFYLPIFRQAQPDFFRELYDLPLQAFEIQI